MSLRSSSNLVAGIYQFTMWRFVPCLALVTTFRVPRERHVALAKLIRSRQSQEFRSHELTSCGALNAAVTAALAANLAWNDFFRSANLCLFLFLRWGCREHSVGGCWHSPGRDYGRYPRECWLSALGVLHPGVPVMWYAHIRDLFPTAETVKGAVCQR